VGKGTSILVGGTGKLVGIQGSAEFTRMSLRPVAEGSTVKSDLFGAGYEVGVSEIYDMKPP
jgi:hypothetical protein